MALYPAPTSGVGVAAAIKVQGNETPLSTTPGYNNVTLSISGAHGFPTSFQLNPQLVDAAGTPVPAGTALVLASVAAGTGAYTGTITGGATNALVGKTFNIAGFTNAVNNGSFIVTASSATVLTVDNAASVAETHAATATDEESATNSLTYFVQGDRSDTAGTYKPGGTTSVVAQVTASGLIEVAQSPSTPVPGGTVVEVSYPFANNAIPAIVSSGNPMNGLPVNKIYAEVNVTVIP